MPVSAGFDRFGQLKVSVTTLPAWGKTVLAFAAVPGFVLLALSALAVAASLLVLLLTVGPVYWLLLRLFGQQRSVGVGSGLGSVAGLEGQSSAGRRRVDATVVDGSE